MFACFACNRSVTCEAQPASPALSLDPALLQAHRVKAQTGLYMSLLEPASHMRKLMPDCWHAVTCCC